jgi:hypothetical protein
MTAATLAPETGQPTVPREWEASGEPWSSCPPDLTRGGGCEPMCAAR